MRSFRNFKYIIDINEQLARETDFEINIESNIWPSY